MLILGAACQKPCYSSERTAEEIGTKQTVVSLDTTPKDCIKIILDKLDGQSIARGAQTNKCWYEIINQVCQNYVKINCSIRVDYNNTIKSYIAYRGAVESLQCLILSKAQEEPKQPSGIVAWACQGISASLFGEEKNPADTLTNQFTEAIRAVLLEKTNFSVQLVHFTNYFKTIDSHTTDKLVTNLPAEDQETYKKYNPETFLETYNEFYSFIYGEETTPIQQIPGFELIPSAATSFLAYEGFLSGFPNKLKQGATFQGLEQFIYNHVTNPQVDESIRASYKNEISDYIDLPEMHLETLEFLLLFTGCGDNMHKLAKQDRYKIIYKISDLRGPFINNLAAQIFTPLMLAKGDFQYMKLDNLYTLQQRGNAGSKFAQHAYAKFKLAETTSLVAKNEIYEDATQKGWIGAQSAIIEQKPELVKYFTMLNYLNNNF